MPNRDIQDIQEKETRLGQKLLGQREIFFSDGAYNKFRSSMVVTLTPHDPIIWKSKYGALEMVRFTVYYLTSNVM